MKTWLITGASRGLGLEMARAALAAGDRVVATARRPEGLARALGQTDGRLLGVALDVTDRAAIDQTVREAIAYGGRIDVLVNNAGYGLLGSFEELAPDEIAKQISTNLFGVLDVTRAVLPQMRAQRAGRIITVGSIAGLRGFAGSSVYCASKHAIAGWSEALAAEVAPFGIAVTCLHPGRFRTDFLDPSSVHHGAPAIADYAEASAVRRQELDQSNHRQPGDPAKLAAVVLALAAMENPPVSLALGSDAHAVLVAKIADLRRDVETWSATTKSTDHDAS